MKPCLILTLIALWALFTPCSAQVALPYGPAPGAPHSMTSEDREQFTRTLALVGLRGFGVDFTGGDSALVKFDLDAPATLNRVATAVRTYAGGFDITQSFLWAIQTAPPRLMRIDTATGGQTVIGPTPALGTDNWVALKVDPTSGTLYAASTNGSTSTLYTVNATTGAPTVVGTITGVPILIAMAFNNAGQLFGYDIDAAGTANSRFFRIDKQSGTGTLVGDMGFIARFAQDMEFDRLTNRCYLAAYNYSLSRGELRTADITTGATTLIGPLGAGSFVEIDCFGIKGLPDQQPPTVQHVPPANVLISSNDTVRATITDNVGVAGATLSYRKAGTVASASSAMALVGTQYEAVIPGASITAQGIEYFITAQDAGGNTGRWPAAGFHSVPVRIGGDGLSRGIAQPSGSEQTAYRLVSIPFSANDATPRGVLEDDLGAYDPTKWRFFELRPDQTYAEYPNTSSMSPGKAFWLIVKDAGKTVDTGPGQTNGTGAAFSVPLNSGWNFVANPFNYSIPTGKLSLASGDTLVLRSYLGSSGWNTTPITAILPFEGYAVNVATATNLIINPDLSLGAIQKTVSTPASTIQWSIRILARCQSAVDEDNLAQANMTADEGVDRNDMAEPPPIGEYVSVYFPHPDWETRTKKFCVDARPPTSDEGDDWCFEASSNIDDRIFLRFGEVKSVPPQFDVWLLDHSLKTTQNLRSADTYEYRNVASEAPRQFSLLVGKASFIRQRLLDAQAVPVSFELSQNFPNPFNPTTTIRYGLPKESHVTLKVYNILGQEVATLVDEVQEQGYKTVQFPQSGREAVSSGTYFYRLQADNYTATRKLTLLK
jgi:hypothetical protein